MKRVVITCLTVPVIGIAGVVALGASAATHPRPQAALSSALGRCPAHALPLPAEAVARAADQARIQAPTLYKGFGPAIIVRSQRAPYDGARGGEVKRQCGRMVFRRTVVADLFFPQMLPSASLSQGTVFVSLLPTGYSVWEVAH